MAEITVIVPVYKTEKYLKRCVESIIRQTFTDFEIVLIDDGSSDGCPAICDRFSERYPFIHVIHQQNHGLSAARNAGMDWMFSNSKSKWVTFIDSDDWIHPQYLQILYEMNQNFGTEVSCVGFRKVKNGQHLIEKEIRKITEKKVLPEKIYISDNGWLNSHVCGLLIARQLVEDVRFLYGKNWEDIAFVYRFLFSVKHVAISPEQLYYYNQRPESIVQAKWKPSRLDELDAYEVILPYFRDYRGGFLYPHVLFSYLLACEAQIDMIKNNCERSIKKPEEYISAIADKREWILQEMQEIEKWDFRLKLKCFVRSHKYLGKLLRMVKK